MKRVLVILAGIALAAGLAACGEREQVVVYKQGQYQGKRDQQPFAGPPWNGNQAEWTRVITTRNQAQNEYVRVK
jgi:hypothetical protein